MTAMRRPNFDAPPRDELRNGDHMTAAEFHRLYEQSPPGFRAELVGGVVFVSSPVHIPHSIFHPPLTTSLYAYRGHTPGVQCGDNGTLLLGDDAEPQPDLYLRVLPEYGGQSGSVGDCVRGAPELVVEIAQSSRSIDLHAKRADYARYGVREYFVLNLIDLRFHWFNLAAGAELTPDPQGVMRSVTFPGLWIDGPAVIADDYHALMATLNAGLATPEHATFVAELAARRAQSAG